MKFAVIISKDRNFAWKVKKKMNSLPACLNRISYFILGSIVIVAMLTGCATKLDHAPFVTELHKQNLTVLTGSAESSDTIISDTTTTAIICRSPSAFAIREASESSDINLVNLGGSNDSEKSKAGESGIELRGRTATLLITQEVMYRFCEMSRNAKLTKAEQIDMFMTILNTLEGPWDTLSGNEHNTNVKEIVNSDSAALTPDTNTPPSNDNSQ